MSILKAEAEQFLSNITEKQLAGVSIDFLPRFCSAIVQSSGVKIVPAKTIAHWIAAFRVARPEGSWETFRAYFIKMYENYGHNWSL